MMSRSVLTARTLAELVDRIGDARARNVELGHGLGAPLSWHNLASAPVAEAPEPAPPLGALGLSASGLAKVRLAITCAASLERLAALDAALTRGDIPRLRGLLDLAEEDLQAEGSTDASDSDAEEDEYDPFATEPAGLLGAFLSAYEDSDGEVPAGRPEPFETGAGQEAAGPPSKRLRGAPEGPLSGWAWLASRTQQHRDFRAPALLTESRWCTAEHAGRAGVSPRIVAVAISSVYAGDAVCGYDPRHVGRVSAVDEEGRALVDLVVRPRTGAAVLDCRTHLTGLTREALEGTAAVDAHTARAAVLAVLRPDTVLVGYRLQRDLEALKIWHGPLVDVSLLFGVSSRKRHQYHPMRHIVAQVLQVPSCERSPLGALEAAQLSMRLAQHEARRPVPTEPFEPEAGNPCELFVRHIPHAWGVHAASRVKLLCPGVIGEIVVHWSLNESDPTDWRGDAILAFPSSAARDQAFGTASSLTDVHVQWDDVPGAPPLGAFLTEHCLVEAFSRFGAVACARIPRRPTTHEPQSFAFISFVGQEDAESVAKKSSVEVQITPTWTLSLKPRLAKFGHSTDKRVPVEVGPAEDAEGALDWVHLCRK